MIMKILIIGATSAIAASTAKIFLQHNNEVLLTARNPFKLKAVANDLTLKSKKEIKTMIFDATDFENHKQLFYDAVDFLKGLDLILIANGTLPVQEKILNDTQDVLYEIDSNAISVISISTIAADFFEQQGYGTIAVISSVAGDRGRQSNYIYGAAKGFVSIFLQGLRNRLYPKGIHVLTIKPGFVDTPMTADNPKNFLFATPDKVASDIYKAIINKKDIIYNPWFWRYIMLIIKLIPERIFKKMKM
jgi:short-subunit dehydrogenase